MPTLKALGRDAHKKKPSAASKKAPSSAPPPTSFKSSEYVQESEEEEPENSEKENQSDSDAESLPLNPANVLIKSNGKLPRPAGSSSSSENESSSDESDSEADNEDEEEQPLVGAKQTIIDPHEKSTKSSTNNVVTFRQPPPYKPPVGFEKISLDGTPKVGHIFKKSSLEGKQIWYVTAPASLPVSSIGQISLKDATDSKPVVNHNGNEYGFVRDSAEDKTYTKIMVPSGSDDGYRLAKKSINQIFHLQQIVQLPGVQNSNRIALSSSKATVPARKPIRQQPEGLKMRFRPIGFGNGETGKIGSSSSSVDGSTGGVSDEDHGRPAVRFRKPINVASDKSEAEESSEDSESDEESSHSEAPPIPTRPIVKEKTNKTSPIVQSSQNVTNGSLKRKQSSQGAREPRHSSSRLSSIDDRELKRLKENQAESQKSLEDKASLLIEPRNGSLKQLPAKAEVTSAEHTPIRPPKSNALSHSSPAPQAKVNPRKNDRGSPEKFKPRKRDHSEPATPAKKNGMSPQDLTKATGPSLSGDERRKKMKKMRNKD